MTLIIHPNLFVNLLFILLLVNTATINAQHVCKKCEVENLEVEPDYRSVKLKWNYYHSPEPAGFRVSYNSKKESLDNLVKVGENKYEANIYDLRTLTNYSFNVKADLRSIPFNNRPMQYPHHHHQHHQHFVYDDQSLSTFYDKSSSREPPFSSFYDPLKAVVVETKGCKSALHHIFTRKLISSDKLCIKKNFLFSKKKVSARTILCLANASDVLVNTGPYFGGKVAVENATDERCAVYGNRSDSKEVYKLTIIHDFCGSKIIDNSRIESMIMVHENKDILTHNSRRYLVVCNFVPETYTLKASVDMPPHLLKRKKIQEEDARKQHTSEDSSGKDNGPNHIFTTYERYKLNNVRDSRMLAHQQHKLLNTIREPKVIYYYNLNL
ncbi:hypothetical protein B4U79_15870 [Dinothrombium tinctorium]|uniref:Fibronectin type-III domain-containing protein n=1 Tax=Dinothrombium tinctorium TaxID=1965070 RepID=A0A3S3SC18_9ACAR|nr:hypothetical protein B4U79_15870 [Dinothrombium tinctorium]